MDRVPLPRAMAMTMAVLEGQDVRDRQAAIFDRFADVLAKRKDHQPLAETGQPVALRWVTNELIGFPLRPFEVHRMPVRFDRVVDLGTSTIGNPTSGVAFVRWGTRPLFALGLVATPAPGQTMVIRPLDEASEPIPGQRRVVTAAGPQAFFVPGMGALRIEGGTVADLRGVELDDLVNDSNWQHIDTVGFPFRPGEIASPAYDPEPQGYAPASLPGAAAARIRMEIEALLRVDPPPVGLAGQTTPSLPSPDPELFLDDLRETNLLRIEKCLEDAVGGGLQADHVVAQLIDGFHQPGVGAAVDTATAQMPTVGTTLLTVSADSTAAVGLGYGTTDFPPARAPRGVRGDVGTLAATETTPSSPIGPWLYMVTGRYRLPFLGEVELAAMAMLQPPPSTPSGLTATRFGDNRPPVADDVASQSVRLTWTHPSVVQSYYLAKTDPGPGLRTVNAPRDAGGFEPLLPGQQAAVDGEPPTSPITFVDSELTVPVDGSRTIAYAVIGADNMARWSSWGSVPHSVTAMPPLVPGLEAVSIELANPPGADASIAGELMIDVTWDFTDRTPDRIVLDAAFVASGSSPAPASVVGFPSTTATPGGAKLEVSFDASGQPSIGSSHDARVDEVGEPVPPDGQRRYRVVVRGLTYDFSAGGDVAIAVVARGAERIRPSRLSAPSRAVVATAADPRPPNTPAFPVDVLWTALPDATGVGRAVLRWDAVPRAEGYVIWQATEAAVRAAVDASAEPPPAGTGMLTRVEQLRTLLTATPAAQDRSLKAFTRLQDTLVRGTSLEIELPAKTSSLFCYRISSVSKQNEESSRSAQVVIAAVPTLNIPGAPAILLRQGATGVTVTALPGPGAPSAGFRLHRVRSRVAAQSLGSMGPPVINEGDPRWFTTTVTSRSGSVVGATAVVDDAVAPSWQPYRYRVVAIGQHDPPAGMIGARSPASGSHSVVVPPPPPTVTVIAVAPAGAGVRVDIESDLPVAATPVGRATISVVRMVRVGGDATVQRRPVVEIDASLVPDTATAPADTAIVRTGIGADGVATYVVSLPDVAAGEHAAGVLVTVTDPLGRALSASFGGAT